MKPTTIKDTFKDTTEVWNQNRGLPRVYVTQTYLGQGNEDARSTTMSFTVKQAKRLRKALKTAILELAPDAYEDYNPFNPH